MITLPESFQEEMKQQLGEEYESYLQSFSRPACHGLRVNTAKISVQEFCKAAPFSLRKVPWVENGFYVDSGEENPARHPFYYAGLYYLQEPSAMTPGSRLPVLPDDRVLDLCAAPGGKATELASRISGNGMVLANDISNTRAKALLKNLEMQGMGKILVTSEDPEHLAENYPEFFDKILLDAPCSGEGMFRREPSMIRHYGEHGSKEYAPLQKKLTEQAYRMLRPGGQFLYSTCTFSREENEEVILELLEAHPDLELLPITPDFEGFAPGFSVSGRDLSSCVHIYPQRMEGEGHFLALLQKKGQLSPQAMEPSLLPMQTKLPKEAEEFLLPIKRDWKQCRYVMVKDQIYAILPGVFPARGLRYLRTGLFLGTVKKDRFEPSQALAMNLKREEYPFCISLKPEDERVIRYLKGETLSLEDTITGAQKGWVLVCVDQYPLGWGKITGVSLKNKYYAGWRMG